MGKKRAHSACHAKPFATSEVEIGLWQKAEKGEKRGKDKNMIEIVILGSEEANSRRTNPESEHETCLSLGVRLRRMKRENHLGSPKSKDEGGLSFLSEK